MKSLESLKDIDWSSWKAKDPATLVFVIKDGQILLIRKKRGLGAGKINGPGGRLEPNETLAECAVREAQEELCITPLDVQKCGELLFQFVDGYSIHVHAFRATDFNGTPTETDEAIPIWSPLQAIPYDEMWEDDEIWLPHLIDNRRFQGRFLFDNDRMLDHDLRVFESSEIYHD